MLIGKFVFPLRLGMCTADPWLHCLGEKLCSLRMLQGLLVQRVLCEKHREVSLLPVQSMLCLCMHLEMCPRPTASLLYDWNRPNVRAVQSASMASQRVCTATRAEMPPRCARLSSKVSSQRLVYWMVFLATLFPGVVGGIPACCVVEGNTLQFCSCCTSSSLSITHSSITDINASAFNSLISLKYLYLNYNDALTNLPAGVFDNLNSLTHLSLHNNALTNLPAGVFDNLSSLTDLDLSWNRALVSLPVGMFDSLTSLTSLYLSYTDLTSLPVGVFDSLTSLTYLDLRGNDLTSVPVGVFDSLTSLTYLDLRGNDLASLPVGVFGSLTYLTHLDLSGNDLTSLPVGVFGSLTYLTYLDLFGNDLTSLPVGVFDSLTRLTDLDLSWNRALASLPVGVFDSLTSLTRLNLRGNDAMSCLPVGVFDSLISLVSLSTSGSPFARSCPPPSPSHFSCSMQDVQIPSKSQLCVCQRCPVLPFKSNNTMNCHAPHSCSAASGNNPFILHEGAGVSCSGSPS